MTYPPEDAYADSVEHRAARCLLSAFAVALSLFALPLVTRIEEAAVLALCGTVAAWLMIGDALWVVKWLISNHTSQRKNGK